jgi:hypothetical protein
MSRGLSAISLTCRAAPLRVASFRALTGDVVPGMRLPRAARLADAVGRRTAGSLLILILQIVAPLVTVRAYVFNYLHN